MVNASLSSQEESQNDCHTPLTQYSTLPSYWFEPPVNLTSPVVQFEYNTFGTDKDHKEINKGNL